MTLRLVDESTFRMSEEEVRKAYTWNTVAIHYAVDNYGNDVHHILQLREEVLKDYPKMSDRDMEIRKITREQSISHAGLTTLFVSIPIDDYLKLREENKIDIR